MSDTAEAQELTLDLQVQEFSLGTLVTNAEAIRDAVKAKLEALRAFLDEQGIAFERIA